MIKYFIICFLVITIHSCCVNSKRNENVTNKLVQSRRNFLRFLDEEKLRAYLSSFGQNLSAQESRDHMVYKRATGKVKKIKKTQAATVTKASDEKRPGRVESIPNPHNFTMSSPRMIKFELEDAKYDADYERLRKTRKLRVRRSSGEDKSEPSGRSLDDSSAFTEPKELLKFVYADAVSFTPAEEITVSKKGKIDGSKTKREVDPQDSTTSDTRKIKITHPLSTSARTKHVSFEELSPKMQKLVNSAIHDAVSKGKASEGDYLKFYYGDKIIKVPVSLSKYISTTVKEKEKEKGGLSDYYTYKTAEKYIKEEVTTEKPYKPTTKYESLYAKYQTFINHDNKKPYLPEKAESYVNFVTPTENPVIKLEEEKSHIISDIPKKSIYYYESKDEHPKSPGPVTFKVEHIPLHEIPKTIYAKPNLYTTVISEKPRDIIPITEDFDESKIPSHVPVPISLPVYPTSYVEYDDNREHKHVDTYEDKNYAFGYHVSDYKSGNNFGHKQTKNNKEIKGEYKILLPDGRIQTTKYFADDSGFHADVSYQNIH